MKDKTKLIAIILVIVTVLVVLVTFFIDKNKEETENSINIVSNYNDFYTVDSCVYRTITYISSKNANDLMLVISDKYKKDNNVNKENILSVFNSVDEGSTFASKKMYYQNINENITKYYVYGKIEQEYYDSNNTKDAYFIVYLDKDKKIFSIEPYSGDIFLR